LNRGRNVTQLLVISKAAREPSSRYCGQVFILDGLTIRIQRTRTALARVVVRWNEPVRHQIYLAFSISSTRSLR
jgi:hypothetical protein